MRTLVHFASLMSAGMVIVALWIGSHGGFEDGAQAAVAAHGLDLPSYVIGLAVGIAVTLLFRFGLTAFFGNLGRWAAALAPGLKLLMLAAFFGSILLFY